jgi:hypothetical protein
VKGKVSYDQGLRMCLACENYQFCRALAKLVGKVKFCHERKQIELQEPNEIQHIVLFLSRYPR